MSEELTQNKIISSDDFGNYTCLSGGKSTLNQLKRSRKVPSKDYDKYSKLMPDGLLLDLRNKELIRVICVIEFKLNNEFNTNAKKEIATKQCNTYCQLLDACFGVITDGSDFIWINPNATNTEVSYNDKDVFGTKYDFQRGFSYIKREDGYPLDAFFILHHQKNKETKPTLTLVEKVLAQISIDNSQFLQEEYKNPSTLARSIWQDVWISKSATPEKSLCTFIEIFMFKFLSDLGVLKEDENGNNVSFDEVISKGKDKCLKYYFGNVREYIKRLFPINENDETTLINGISLSPGVKEDNHVFHRILKKFKSFGDLKNIDPEFKSRIFEDFLKKSISKKNWGQFFTPRNVVKAIVEMSDIDKLSEGAKVCDPACGVGGFLLEPLLTKRLSDFYFDDNKLKAKINYSGFEKGFDLDDKLTIILAKSNFIIYLSDLLKENPTLTKEFAICYNNIFTIFTDSILGSLSEINNDKYDLVMSNPPYVTRGAKNYKSAIEENFDLRQKYTINAMGVEGLFIEKILKEVKEHGKALIIVPEGILYRKNDKKLREYILKTFELNAIISLPKNTFYSTPQKTYILSLTKKREKEFNIIQKESVFVYFVLNIGETKDKQRLPITENDLKDMVKQYKYFNADKQIFSPLNNNCKIYSVDEFIDTPHWLVDKWLTNDEKKEIGIEEGIIVKNINEFKDDIFNLSEIINQQKKELEGVERTLTEVKYQEFPFSQIFDLYDGYSFKSNVYTSKKDDIKLIRIQDINQKSNIKEVRIPKNFQFDSDSIKNEEKKRQYWVKKGDHLISLSGAGGFNIITYDGEEGYLNQRIVKIRLKDEYKQDIVQEFIPVIFREIKIELNREGFGSNNNLSKKILKAVTIKIPVIQKNVFDKEKQTDLSSKYRVIDDIKRKLSDTLSIISQTEIGFE